MRIRQSGWEGGRRLNRGFGGTRGEIRRLLESISELESISSVMSSTLEELGERMSTGEPSALERMAALLSHRIVRVIPIVEPLS